MKCLREEIPICDITSVEQFPVFPHIVTYDSLKFTFLSLSLSPTDSPAHPLLLELVWFLLLYAYNFF